jgi:hypothetical protein
LLVVSGIALTTAQPNTATTRTPLYKVRANIATGVKVEVTTNYINRNSGVKVIAAAPPKKSSMDDGDTSVSFTPPCGTCTDTVPCDMWCAEPTADPDDPMCTRNPFYCVTQDRNEPSCDINNCHSIIDGTMDTCLGLVRCFLDKISSRIRAMEAPEFPPLGGVIDRTY